MQAMAEREAGKPRLGGRVGTDDACPGGQRSGGRRGRGAAGKTPFVAAVETTAERRPRRLRLTVVKGFRKKEVEKLAKAGIAEGTSVVADGLSCETARWAPFTWGNTALGNIKTALAGTYHHVSAKHAQRYLASFACRFNRRYVLDTATERLAWACIQARPLPYRVIVAG